MTIRMDKEGDSPIEPKRKIEPWRAKERQTRLEKAREGLRELERERKIQKE